MNDNDELGEWESLVPLVSQKSLMELRLHGLSVLLGSMLSLMSVLNEEPDYE